MTAATVEELALRARGGDSHARNILWESVRETVELALSRQRGLPRLWDREDLRQEAFVVFAEVCDAWPGAEFAAYFEREYPLELARQVRRAWRKQRRESNLPLALELDGDPQAAEVYRVAELLEGLSRLPATAELALRLHLLWGLPLAHVGRQLGLGRRALGGLLPLARRAAAGEIEGEEERLERLLRGLYAFVDSTGRIRATSRQVRSRLSVSPGEYARLLTALQEAGVLTGRSKGHPGRLPADGPQVALARLRRARRGG